MSNLNKQASLSQVLHTHSPTAKRNYLKGLLILGVLLLGGFLLKVLFFNASETKNIVKFETAPLKRGDLVISVTATGKLEPVTQVDIGIEVSGTVAEINADFNQYVHAGQVLAKLDTRILAAQVKQSQGALNQAKAKLIEAQATIEEKQQALAFMLQARKLSGGQLPAKQDIVSAQASLKRALAQKNVMEGAIFQAEGQLKLNETNLIKASIRTPIDGIVLDRKIEKGQTVAASLQTPVMFTIAKNLTEMELHVDVDEADVGKIKLGQTAHFSVDAYPDKTFPATISEIRYAPHTVGGVVTYQTVLLVDNADLFLRPGMTATADMIVAKATNVWLVPSAALHFNPKESEKNKRKEPSFLEKLLPRGPTGGARKSKKVREKKSHLQHETPQIWILEHNQPRAIKVKLGLNDGENSEVSAPELSENRQVIIDNASVDK